MSRRLALYQKFLKLYPRDYRETYGLQMTQTLADMLDDQASRRGHARIWLRVAWDLPLSIIQQNLIVTGDILIRDTPRYIKRNAFIGGLFIAPFFLIIASGLQKQNAALDSHTQRVILFTGIIVLPAIAFLLNTASYLKWVVDRQHQDKVSLWTSLRDIRHSWPALAAAGLGLFLVLFVFGHDSVHCVTGNPVHELHNWHQTWQCLRQG